MATKASFIVLGKINHIKINDISYYYTDEYNEITSEAIGELFNDDVNQCSQVNIKR